MEENSRRHRPDCTQLGGWGERPPAKFYVAAIAGRMVILAETPREASNRFLARFEPDVRVGDWVTVAEAGWRRPGEPGAIEFVAEESQR